MDKLKIRKTGIALLMLTLIVGNLTLGGWAKALHAANVIPVPNDPHIAEVTLGHDAKMTEPTEDYDSDDTIFAEVELAENEKTFRVKGRLHVIEVPGQNAGPIPALDVIVTVPAGKDTANFQYSNPTNGWPKGKYKFEALLIDASGKTIDAESHEFMVE